MQPHSDDQRRSARRAFIRAHHPDRGGDRDTFVRGLATFAEPEATPPGARVHVVKHYPWPVRMVRALTTRRANRNAPPRVR